MIFLYIVIAIMAIFILLNFIGGFAIAFELYIKGKRSDDQIVEYEVAEKKLDINLLDIPCEELYIQSRFGYKLHARYYEAKEPTHKYVIDIHGRSSSSISQLKYLNIFRDMGYNVLLPDQRNSGQSTHNSIVFYSFGAYEKYDIISWINRIRKKDDKAEIALFGESMGGATAILVTAMDDRVKTLVSYCAYSSVLDIVKAHLGKNVPKFAKLFIPAFNSVSLFLFGIRVWQLNIAKSMAKVKVPTMIIHSYGDKTVHIEHAKKLIAANDKAEVVLFENDAHARSYSENPEQFTKAVQGFFTKVKF